MIFGTSLSQHIRWNKGALIVKTLMSKQYTPLRPVKCISQGNDGEILLLVLGSKLGVLRSKKLSVHWHIFPD